jgi:hypothetical protein
VSLVHAPQGHLSCGQDLLRQQEPTATAASLSFSVAVHRSEEVSHTVTVGSRSATVRGSDHPLPRSGPPLH